MSAHKIFGSPGCGKTHRMLELFEKELELVKPDKIAFLTFTRAAKTEVLSRVSLSEEELPLVRTLHAICYKVLGTSRDGLVLSQDIREFGRAIGAKLTGYMPDPLSLDSLTEAVQQPTKADRLLQLNHLGRHRGLSLRETLRDAPPELDYKYAKWFTKSYRDWKTAGNLLDYTDLLTEYLRVAEPLDIDVLFIDEAQDLSWLQWQVVHKLGARAARTYIAGDDDQTIFTWAGASAELFLTEPCDTFEVLPQSYRIPAVVHRVAHQVIGRVRVRQPKEFRPRDVEGVYKPVGFLDEDLLQDESTYVLYRNYHRGLVLKQRLEDLGVPFTGGQSILANEDVLSAIRGWVKATAGDPIPVDEAKALVAVASDNYLVDNRRHTIKDMKSGELSTNAVFKPRAFEDPWYHVLPRMPRVAYLDRTVSRFGWKALLDPKVRLMSIHQSKGRQAETIILDLEMARRTHEAYQKNPDDEHRVYYVAVTRARNRLFTLLPMDPMSYQL